MNGVSVVESTSTNVAEFFAIDARARPNVSYSFLEMDVGIVSYSCVRVGRSKVVRSCDATRFFSRERVDVTRWGFLPHFLTRIGGASFDVHDIATTGRHRS